MGGLTEERKAAVCLDRGDWEGLRRGHSACLPSRALGTFAFRERCTDIVLGTVPALQESCRQGYGTVCKGSPGGVLEDPGAGGAPSPCTTGSPLSFRRQCGLAALLLTLLPIATGLPPQPHTPNRPSPFSWKKKTKAGPLRKGLLCLNIYSAAMMNH